MTGGNRSNADHRAMAADRTETKGAARQVFESIEVVLRFGHDGLDWRSGHREQLTAQGELFLAMAIGQKTVVTDALESIGKDMNQKAADEPPLAMFRLLAYSSKSFLSCSGVNGRAVSCGAGGT